MVGGRNCSSGVCLVKQFGLAIRRKQAQIAKDQQGDPKCRNQESNNGPKKKITWKVGLKLTWKAN